MSLILLGTILSGVIFSKILLIAGLDHMVVRFSIVLIFAYKIREPIPYESIHFRWPHNMGQLGFANNIDLILGNHFLTR